MQNMSGGKTALGLDTNVGALLCYLPVCAINLVYSILVVVQDKSNRVVRFHAFQSLFLQAVAILVSIPLVIVYVIGAMIDIAMGIPIFTGLLMLVALVISLAILYFLVMAAIKAYNGEIYKIPVVGNFAEKYAG
jgi:uncharacterized membrane protein